MKMRAQGELPNFMGLAFDLINKGETLSQQDQEEADAAQTEDPAEVEAVLKRRKKTHAKISLL